MVHKKRYKPFYKQFLRLRKNIQNRPKLFKFRKQKWVKFQQYLKNQLKFYKRFKIKDQFQLSVSKFASRGNSFHKKFKNNLCEQKSFSLFYGNLKRKYLKSHISYFINSKSLFNSFDYRHKTLKFFESRLDTILYRANFSSSIKNASQLILHGCILVNGILVKTKSYNLKTNDLVEIAHSTKSRNLVKKILDQSNFWPIPPKHLLINYKTLQILFIYTDSSNSIPVFNHYLNVDSVVINIKK
jgi:small subunit ribosomal protein S4